jgi:hypothetical protein
MSPRRNLFTGGCVWRNSISRSSSRWVERAEGFRLLRSTTLPSHQAFRRTRLHQADRRQSCGLAQACPRHRSITRRRLRWVFGRARGIPRIPSRQADRLRVSGRVPAIRRTRSRLAARRLASGHRRAIRATPSHLVGGHPNHLPVLASGCTPPSTAGSGCPKVVAASRCRPRRRLRRLRLRRQPESTRAPSPRPGTVRGGGGA